MRPCLLFPFLLRRSLLRELPYFFCTSYFASSTQPVYALNRAISSTFWASVSVFTCSGCKCPCDDERLLPAKPFCSGEQICTRAWRFILFVNWLLRPSRKLPVVGVRLEWWLPRLLIRFPVSTPRMEVSVYLSRFRTGLMAVVFSVWL